VNSTDILELDRLRTQPTSKLGPEKRAGKRKIIVLQEYPGQASQIRRSVALISQTRADEICFVTRPVDLLAELQIEDRREPRADSPNHNAFVVIGNGNSRGGHLAMHIKQAYPDALVYMYSADPPKEPDIFITGFIRKTLIRPYVPPSRHNGQTVEVNYDHHPDDVLDHRLWKPTTAVPERILAHHEDLAAILCYITPETTPADLMRCFRGVSVDPPA
jgi:hypothetical protein